MKAGKLKVFLCSLVSASMVGLSFAVPVSAKETPAVSAQPYKWKNVQIYGGGYVDNIVFNKGEKNLIYARTDMGGAYRWDQASGSWTPMTDWVSFDDWNNYGCESIAADQTDTNRVYILAGTYTNDWTSSNACLLRSDDKGNTFDETKLPFKAGANMMGRSMGERLAIDPNSDNVLYMGTRCGNGLWKSTDYGVTWAKVDSFTSVGDYRPTQDDPTSYDSDITGVVWVTFDPSSSEKGTPCSTIYVGVANKVKSGAAAEDTIYCSKDGGKTWNAVPGQPKNNFLPHHGVLSSTGTLYIAYDNNAGPYNGTSGDVWKYDTKTGEWTMISPVPSTDTSNDYFGYGGLAVDDENPDTIMVSTLNSWWPDANIYRSTDGGKTWTSFWSWNGYPDRTLRYTQDISASPWLTFGNVAQPPVPSPKLGWMMGNLSIDPFDSNRMFYGTGATVYGTDNLTDIDSGGKVKLSVAAKGIEQTAVQDLISPASGDAHLISSLGDVCGFVHKDLDSVPSMMMTSPTFSTTDDMDYAELDPAKYVRVGETDKGTSPRIGISYDTGTNWYSVNNCWNSNDSDTTQGGHVAMSADGNTIVWAPKGQDACFSGDTGSSWTKCKGLPQNAVLASDRVNSDKFYAYAGGAIYTSMDGGKTFSKSISKGIPDGSSVSIKAMPGAEGDIWLAGGYKGGNYGLWHSTDSGESFEKLSNVDEADTIGFGKAAPGKSYMALYTSAKINGVRGIFRSDDAGENWVRINDDMHQYGMTNSCITGDPRIYGRVYVGTNGRGILYADPDGSVVGAPSISPTSTSFDKNTQRSADVPVKLTLNGTTLTKISNGSDDLVKGTDYVLDSDGSEATVSKEYLDTLPVGDSKLTFTFSSGATASLSISVTDTTKVTDSEISPTTASFDKYDPAGIRVAVTLNGNTLTDIKDGSSVLVKGTDYAVSEDGTVTISKDYLSTLATGVTKLTFDFSGGQPQTLTVNVKDSTPSSSILPTTALFDKYVPGDIPVAVTLNGNTLVDIRNGVTVLKKGTEYTVSEDGAVTISKDYLSTLARGVTKLTFDFSAGEPQTLEITVTDTTPIQKGKVEVQEFSYNPSATSNTISVNYQLTNKGDTAVDLSKLSLRYYFTEEGNEDEAYTCDWCQAGQGNVIGTFVKMDPAVAGADQYLNIAFSSAAGRLAPGQTINITGRVYKSSDWSNYDQSNDYSFSTGSGYADNSKVTAYLDGTLIWGIEP